MTSAFSGIRILDFTRHQQGPSGTVLLGDMGAEVIKVEEPGGEQGRGSGLGPDGFSAYFEAHNRGKKSIVLNMRKPEAIEIVKRLIPSCDVVTENYRPGVMERWGLGYDELEADTPRHHPGLGLGLGAQGAVGEPARLRPRGAGAERHHVRARRRPRTRSRTRCSAASPTRSAASPWPSASPARSTCAPPPARASTSTCR